MPRSDPRQTIEAQAAVITAAAAEASHFVVSQFRGQGRFGKIQVNHRETTNPAPEVIGQAADALFMDSVDRPAIVYAVYPGGGQEYVAVITPPHPPAPAR